MRALVLALALPCLACGAQPAPVMWGADRFETTVDGRRYVVFRKDDTVEVIRLGLARPGEHRAIRAAMIDLAQRMTGCSLVASTMAGDSGEMRGRLTCPETAR
ncbi:hypothetical protein E7811_16660 [Aliigemmobacter aestuarii]|uniref:Uncharacterized protein n=1 Tax=Aliigemmobacter aestuarii TaxID=1445661 RepID=A0A4S3MJY5_9RHOB|nr:hypothetical protein [Gemmobacter aestuarii]THD81536.1 hypothetical protein E7811_16660 [Gemmobacter aestuarii]